MKRNYIRLAIGLILLNHASLFSEFNIHKYFAPMPTFGSRAERKGMLTFDAWGLHGNTTKGKNSQGETTNVLNIYGPQEMHQLGRSTMPTNIIADPNNILNQLWNIVPVSNKYAQLEFSGKCSFTGGAFTTAVSLTPRAFVGINVPYYKLSINDISYKDITPPAERDAAWIQFLNNFDEILKANDLSLAPSVSNEVGDIAVYAGWTLNNEGNDQLEFIDCTLRFGFLAGNTKKIDPNLVFSLPGGYNGHRGILADLNLGLGMHSKIGFDLYAKAIVLFDATDELRMKTTEGQNSFIKLAKGTANFNPGNIYSAGGVLRFDMFEQLGWFFGYLYNHREADKLTPTDSLLFPPAIVNSSPEFKGWSMHVLNVGLEVDFTHVERRIHPKARFDYNYIVKGTRIFLNNTVGGSVGLAITADF